jgi:hypothetical protein
MTAAAKGHLEIVKLLVLKGADLKKQLKGEGLTALDIADLYGHEIVVDYLINAGARFDEGAEYCNVCGTKDPNNTLRCMGCKAVFYCCEECQRSDWKNHKAQCRNMKAMREEYEEQIKFEEEMDEWCQKLRMEASKEGGSRAQHLIDSRGSSAR